MFAPKLVTDIFVGYQIIELEFGYKFEIVGFSSLQKFWMLFPAGAVELQGPSFWINPSLLYWALFIDVKDAVVALEGSKSHHH